MAEEITLEPVEGRYDTDAVPGYELDPPPFGTQMSSGELDLCTDSDDSRFSNNSASGYVPRQIWKFDLSAYAVGAIEKLKPVHEGYSIIIPTASGANTTLLQWRVDTEEWRYQDDHSNAYDTVIEREAPYDGGHIPSVFINESGELWIFAHATDIPLDRPLTLYTDQVKLVVTVRLKVAVAVNLFGQRFRLFDDGDNDDISFERLDERDAAWSTPTQPFSGDGNANPALEALPTGALRAAYIDVDGALQKMVSLDDGETWGAE